MLPPLPPPAPPSVVLIRSLVAHDVVDVTLTTQKQFNKENVLLRFGRYDRHCQATLPAVCDRTQTADQ